MRLAKITERLSGLGSEKWAVHIEGRRRAALGEPLIFLSIGEPDAPPPAAILDEAEKQMRAGRIRYAEGRGEANARRALARVYTRQTGRAIHENQFIYLPGTQTALYAAMMTVCDMGDEVLMADPYYATYEGVIAAAGGVTVPRPTWPCTGASGGVMPCAAGRPSGRQNLPALGAPRVQHPAAALGRHARTEAVAAGANEVRRLERALHRVYSGFLRPKPVTDSKAAVI